MTQLSALDEFLGFRLQLLTVFHTNFIDGFFPISFLFSFEQKLVEFSSSSNSAAAFLRWCNLSFPTDLLHTKK